MTGNKVVTNQFWYVIVASLNASGSNFNQSSPNLATVRCFQNNANPGPSGTDADFVECDFSGYAAVEATAHAAQQYRDIATGQWVTQPSGDFSFISDDVPITPQTVYGTYLTIDALPGKVVWYERFATPKVIDSAGQGFTVDVDLAALVNPLN